MPTNFSRSIGDFFFFEGFIFFVEILLLINHCVLFAPKSSNFFFNLKINILFETLYSVKSFFS